MVLIVGISFTVEYLIHAAIENTVRSGTEATLPPLVHVPSLMRNTLTERPRCIGAADRRTVIERGSTDRRVAWLSSGVKRSSSAPWNAYCWPRKLVAKFVGREVVT